MMLRFQVLLAMLLLVAVSGGVQAADIQVDDPYARAVPPGQPNSAVFMSLTNGTSQDQALVAAASPVARVVELHTHVEEDGMKKMRRVERIEIPAGATVALKPGGLHIMLIGLQQTLEPGALLDLTLEYADGTSQALRVPVRKIDMTQHSH